MPKNFLGEGGLASCISRFFHPSKTIRDKYINLPKAYTIENLVFIAEEKKKIWRNRGVSNVYKFLIHILEVLSFTTKGDIFI